MPNVAANRVLLLGTETIMSGAFAVTGVTATVASKWIDCASEGVISLYLRGIGTITSGTILIEEADWSPSEGDYSGTPSVLQTISASAVTGNAQIGYHFIDSSYGFVRVRISVVIGGGGSITFVKRCRGSA